MPGVLAKGDLEAIAEASGSSVQDYVWLAEHFEASDGAKAARFVEGGIEVFAIATIVPQQRKHGCVFLDADGTCSIHEVAPFGCSHHDVHMTREEGDRRLKPMLAELMNDTDHQERWHLLRKMGRIARPLVERRRKFAELFAGLEAAAHG
jgi:Fe-S-cluster containining protein